MHRKRKSDKNGGFLSSKQSRVIEVSTLLDSLHAEPSGVLEDLLNNQSLIFVEGPVGCGKSSLVRRVAENLDLPLKVIQLSDQLDSKSFIGSYQCTEVPGEFIWEPSLFSEAVRSRCLILLEDIDSATPDLVSALLLACESWSTVLRPGCGPERFHEDVRIVATVRSESSAAGESAELIRSNPLTITLPAFGPEDLVNIVQHKFPVLTEYVQTLLTIFTDVNTAVSKDNMIDRELNSNDLIRACRRLAGLPKLNDNSLIFIELSDVFVLSISHLAKRSAVAEILGRHLSLSDESVDHLLAVREVPISRSTDLAKFGRVQLPVRHGHCVEGLSTRSFGLTLDARLLMERIAVCIAQNGTEAVLLTGETGVGKTSVVQLMASYLNVELDVVNLSQDSDSTDLIGGFKPVAIIEFIKPITTRLNALFENSFNVDQNEKFLSHFRMLLSNERYLEYLQLIVKTARKVIESDKADSLKWAELLVDCARLEKSLHSGKSSVPFSYVEGVVARAAREGRWLLVDEVNLASSDCLDAIISVLDGVISTHPDFRLFACMNPATDTGKRKLPPGVRSRFTEFFVHEPTDQAQLKVVVTNYLPNVADAHLLALLNFYRQAIGAFPRKYSLRNLCRALCFAAEDVYTNAFRSIYEGVVMAFANDLDAEGSKKLNAILSKHFPSVPAANAKPNPDKKQVLVEGSYIEQGNAELQADSKYIYTKSVKSSRAKLARAVASGRFPVLLEGETSAGKTSMIMDLALTTGNVVHRINNHEHTDLQEYIGCYAPDAEGRLTFVEGVLLQAVRQGDWVILDELNLAPVEVLEALNRLLDDNRELFIAEKNIAVKAHPRFRLFATQNPVGTYAGRKRLSRAFLNRFVVLRFDHPPFEELVEIVCARCSIAPSPAKCMINVLTQLKMHRASTGLFNSSDGLMTLRDLFRWANRLASNPSGEWKQILAEQGFFLLASRCRTPRDAEQVVSVLEAVFKVKINEEHLFGPESPYLPEIAKQAFAQDKGIVSTLAMRRMLILAAEAFRCNEPVLMVGETGCGKTTAATVLSAGHLLSINCHERTETADLLGTIRPRANGGFFWQDGVVVQAMKAGTLLLIDEISLAADSVLERLNPLLESSRTVLLTDAGASAEVVKAAEGFQVVATMNPGTDYGKKELSKALRNRFTEIWCSCDFPVEDIRSIVASELDVHQHRRSGIVDAIVDFFVLFNAELGHLFRTVFSVRDIVAAAHIFVACQTRTRMPVANSYLHAVTAVAVDGIGIIPSRIDYDQEQVIEFCEHLISTLSVKYDLGDIVPNFKPPAYDGYFNIGSFSIPKGACEDDQFTSDFHMSAECVKTNAIRVARALMVNKPVMLEGEPGVGKSSLIAALASITGHRLVRLNLSDQTDLSDLFGHDVPVSAEDGSITFEWQDGPVLKAIKEGSWVLLDEMNLASQSVLEGLNSCFDFRQQLFIADINKTFEIDGTTCRFFACQNPQRQGGNRRALPKSFLNRFTSIYVRPLNMLSLTRILHDGLHDSEKNFGTRIIKLNREVARITDDECPGHTYEFNLRDLHRMRDFYRCFGDEIFGADLIYVSRFPSLHVRKRVVAAIKRVFGYYYLPRTEIQFDDEKGVYFGERKYSIQPTKAVDIDLTKLLLLSSQETLLQQLAACVKLDWLVLLSGARHSGKSSAVRVLASLAQVPLIRMKLNKETDATELLGAYEQVVNDEELESIRRDLLDLFSNGLRRIPPLYKKALLQATESTDALNVKDIRRIIAKASELAEIDISDQTTLGDLTRKVESVFLSFKWRPSVFVDAYTKGSWLVIEDVNCCSAAVLDRLNTCLEANGSLVLSEESSLGTGPIKPHPNFRVFFTMDPKNGPLSRAMRNRAVEIAIGPWNSWFGDPRSALNVVLAREQAMCSTLPLDVFEKTLDPKIEEVKQMLQVAARHRLTAVERLAAIDPTGTLQPAPSTLPTGFYDKISFVYGICRPECLLILLPELEPRLPPAELVLFGTRSNRSQTPTLRHAAWRWQMFDRWTRLQQDSVGQLLCTPAGFILALCSTTTEVIVDDDLLNITFTGLKPDFKACLQKVVRSLILNRGGQNSGSPSALIDSRFFSISSVYFADERIDKVLLTMMLQWLATSVSTLSDAADSQSPYALSRDFLEAQADISTLNSRHLSHVYAFIKTIASICAGLNVADCRGAAFDKSILHFLTNVLVMAVEMTRIPDDPENSGYVHPLLYVRQCMQDLAIDPTNARKPLSVVCEVLFNDKFYKQELNKFMQSIGYCTTNENVQYSRLLDFVCHVRPMATKDEAESVIGPLKQIRETIEHVRKSQIVGRKTLRVLTEGLHECVTAFGVMETSDCSKLVVIFPDSPVHIVESIEHINFRDEDVKRSLQCLMLMNTSFGIRKIDPSFKLSNVRTHNVMIDVICNFWSAFHFSTTSLSAVALKDLGAASTHVGNHRSLTWMLDRLFTGSFAEFDQKLGALQSIPSGGYVEYPTIEGVYRNAAKNLANLIPRKGMVDPALAELVQFNLAQTKRDVVRLFTDCDIVFPVVSSTHPLLRFLTEAEKELDLKISNFELSIDNVYRSSHLKFDDLRDDLSNFYKQWKQLYDRTSMHTGGSMLNRLSRAELDSVFLMYHQMSDMLVTLNDKLVFDYYDLPDVVVPLLLVVQVLHVVVSYDKQCAAEALNANRVHEKFGFNGRIDPVTFNVDVFATSKPFRETCLAGQEGPMPMQLQTLLTESFILSSDPFFRQAAVDWLIVEWDQWYAKHSVRKAELFTVKQRTQPSDQGDAEDDEMTIDPEDIEIRQLLPNFANSEFVNAKPESLSSRLPEPGDILRLSRRIIADDLKTSAALVSQQVDATALAFLPAVWVFDHLKHSSLIKNESRVAWCVDSLPTLPSTIVDGHLVALKAFEGLLAGRGDAKKASKTPINVYTENDPSEVIRSVDAIRKLLARLTDVRNEFPDEANLKEIERIVHQFLDCDCGVPQLRMASWIENILERSELWQSISPREFSLAAQLDELQTILVDWRKMQVLSWQHIIRSVEEDSRALAFATSFPLVSTFIEMARSQDWDAITNFYTMILSWIMSSTLVDFEARLEFVHFLERLAVYMSDFIVIGADVPVALRSMRFFFEAFKPLVTEKIEAKRRQVVHDLEDFVSVVKFQDLNLWSVKASTQRAHEKLFKIVKRFKTDVNSELGSVFIEFLPPVPVQPAFEVALKPTLTIAEDDSFDFVFLHERLRQVLNTLPGHDEPESLSDTADELLSILSTDVVYAEDDDEANEKLQGRALADRQRRFARLVKQAAAFGLRSRRSTGICAENTLQDALSSLATGSGINNDHFRACVVARNVVTRLVNQLSENSQPLVMRQLTPQMIAHIRGLTTFIFAWLTNMVAELSEIAAKAQAITAARDEIHILAGRNETHPSVHHRQQINDRQVEKVVRTSLTTIIDAVVHAKALVALAEAVPPTLPQGEFALPSGSGSGDRVPLTKDHADYEAVLTGANTVLECFEALRVEAEKFANSKSFNGFWCRKSVFAFFDAKQRQIDLLRPILARDNNSALFRHFPRHCVMISKLEAAIPSLRDVLEFQNTDPSLLSTVDTDSFQRRVQQIYKSVATKAADEKSTPLDVIKQIALGISKGTNFSTEIGLMDFVSEQIATSDYQVRRSDIATYERRLTEIADTLALVDDALVQFANRICVLFVHLAHVFARILRKGLVNPIPKKEQGEGGQGNDIDDAGGENCGMGEGEGAKDVGNEIEETGQVEDLRNDDETPSDDPQQSDEQREKPKDSETPLEMEDDFAADLEDIDGDEQGDDENDDGEDKDDLDWGMDQVDEPNEVQLDPMLWEKPPPEETKDDRLDEKADGADDRTDDMAAKERDDTVAREKDDKQDGKGEGEHEEEDKEGEDDLENANDVEADDQGGKQEDDDNLPADVGTLDADEAEAEDDEGEEDQDKEQDLETTEMDDETEEKEPEGEVPGKDPEQPIEEGAQPDEADQSSRGKAGAVKQQQQADGGQDDEQDPEEDPNADQAEAMDVDDENGDRASDDKQKASKTAADKIAADKQDTEKVGGEEHEEAEQQAVRQRATEDDTDAVPEISNNQGDVDEAMDDDTVDEQSRKLAHIGDEQKSAADRRVIQKSTIDEACSTKSEFERLRPRYDDATGEVPLPKDDRVMEDIAEEDEEDAAEPMDDEAQKQTVIHIATDFFDLATDAVRDLEDYEEAAQAGGNDSGDSGQPGRFAYVADSVSLMASELAENLRQILEPTIANRLQGDYRTGKRLNMRRLVSYIASDYRKNRIWLRRTKKQQRNFQILVAVDDSRSMSDNRMTEVTCQSLCLIEKAFRQLEIGQLAICKFGSSIRMLRDFSSAADTQDSLTASLLEELKFDQDSTNLIELLAFARRRLTDAKANASTSALPSQMLIIVGDGQGMHSQGGFNVTEGVRLLVQDSVTVLYVIVDGHNSVLNSKYGEFVDGKPVLRPYMSCFPFPFYALVRSIATLPGVLAEAIRQWFDLALRE